MRDELDVDISNIHQEDEVLTKEDLAEPAKNSVEELARSHGWNPEGEKTADEFIAFALDNLPERGKQLKRMQKTMDALVQHNRNQEQIAYDRAVRDLTAQKEQAISRGDVDAVRHIEQQTNELKPVTEISPAIADFQDKHSEWLFGTSAEDKQMQAYTFGMDSILMKENLSPEDHMDRLEEAVKEHFPDRFGIKPSVRSPVESSVGSNVSNRTHKKTFGVNDLSAQQRQIAEEFEFYKIMTKEQYVKDLVKSGELK